MADPQLELIERYKELIQRDHNEPEIYKWELIQSFQEKLHRQRDITSVIGGFNFGNLIDWRPAGFVKNVNNFKDKAREMFEFLYDENIPLLERIIRFGVDSSDISEEQIKNNGWHQDARCMFVYLTFRYPEIYSIYKSTFYEHYCKLLGIKPLKDKYEKAIHCQQLIKDFISDYIVSDHELLELSASTLNENCYKEKNHRLLAQDILYRTLEYPEKAVSQNSPVNDFKKWLHDERINRNTKQILNFLAQEQKGSDSFVSANRLRELYSQYLPSKRQKPSDISHDFSQPTTKNGQYVDKVHKPLQQVVEYIPADAKQGVPKTDYRIVPELVREVTELVFDFFSQKKSSDFSFPTMTNNPSNSQPLNRILYGPPGTGKTFQTMNKAIEILEPEFYASNKGTRDVLKQRYKELRSIGQIEFVTFHQSYGYEEFVEGIRADTKGENVSYKIENGVFRKICKAALENYEKAKNPTNELERFENISTTLLSEAIESQKEFELRRKDAEGNKGKFRITQVDEDRIIIVSDTIKYRENFSIKLSEVKKVFLSKEEVDTNKKSANLNGYQYGRQEDSYILAIVDNLKNYKIQNFPEETKEIRHRHYKIRTSKVAGALGLTAKEFRKHLATTNYGIKPSDREINFNVAQGVIRHIAKKQNKDAFEILENLGIGYNEDAVVTSQTQKETLKNYLLIIDEINRGNISKILGELITLLEETKRTGADEELELTLPYSGNPFSVPPNLYILGTMNSADRSIALLDTALRRRFHFEEMMPQPELLQTIDGINLAEVLRKMNERIEYLYDRDHIIGHAYLIECTKFSEVQEVFLNKILPLLQEYFYDDWEKINLIFGNNGFLSKKDVKFAELFKGNANSSMDGEKSIYTIDANAFKDPQSYRKIYETASQNYALETDNEAA